MVDPILYWNDEASESNRRDFTRMSPPEQGGPTLSSRAFAIAHLAMYDGWFGVTGGKPPYLATPYAGAIPAGMTTQEAAAIALGAAAHQALVKLFPAQTAELAAALSFYPFDVNNPANAALKQYGEKAADDILMARSGDPGAGGPYTFLSGRPNHQPDPLRPELGIHGPVYGTATPFATTSNPTLLAPPYNNGNEPAYVKAYNQVYDRGGARFQNTTTRTPEQTVIGLYWAYDGVYNLGTPPRLYNQIVSTVARPLNLSTDELMELFAHVNVAMGDAGIFAWREKYKWNFWRPVVGIRHHHPSTGPDAVAGQLPGGNNAPKPIADPFWVYLGAPSTNTPHPPFTPPFPAYPSGHATFGAAAFQAARLALKRFRPSQYTFNNRMPDGLAFDYVSDELNGVSADLPQLGQRQVRTRHLRRFNGLWDAIVENGISRVYLGVHWSFDAFAENDAKFNKMVGGVPLGLKIAEDIASRDLQPLSPGPPTPSPAPPAAASGGSRRGARAGRPPRRK